MAVGVFQVQIDVLGSAVKAEAGGSAAVLGDGDDAGGEDGLIAAQLPEASVGRRMVKPCQAIRRGRKGEANK